MPDRISCFWLGYPNCLITLSDEGERNTYKQNGTFRARPDAYFISCKETSAIPRAA